MTIQTGDLFVNVTKKHMGLKVVVTEITPYQVHFRHKGPGSYADKHEEMFIERFLTCYRLHKPAKKSKAQHSLCLTQQGATMFARAA